jgi:hypothetical protein
LGRRHQQDDERQDNDRQLLHRRLPIRRPVTVSP